MWFSGSPVAVQALCILTAFLPAVVAIAPRDTAPIATDKSGRSYCGYKPVPSVQAFLGIPYAQPPVGPLRWKPPQPLPPPPHGGIIQDASKFGKSCYQFLWASFLRDPSLPKDSVSFSNVTTEQSEDCLSLNVWAPELKDPKKLLPVMLWIHGGAFSEGSSSFPSKHYQPGFSLQEILIIVIIAVYNGANVVEAHQDVIVVTFKYISLPQSFLRVPIAKHLCEISVQLPLEHLWFSRYSFYTPE